MKLNKGISMVEISFIIFVFGMLAAVIFPVIKTQYITGKVEREMPKTFEYVTAHDNLELVKFVCKKDNSDKMFSDEVCYNRMKTFDYCKNDFPFTVENEKQVETIFNNCKLKKQEILNEVNNWNNVNNIDTNEISGNLQSK